MKSIKLNILGLSLALLPFACKVLDRTSEINESSRAAGVDRYNYVDQDDRTPDEKFKELLDTVSEGVLLVTPLGKDDAGLKDYQKTYAEFKKDIALKSLDAADADKSSIRANQAKRRMDNDEKSKCKGDSYLPIGALKKPASTEAKDCATELESAVGKSLTSIESYLETHHGYLNALKNYMGAKYALLEVEKKPLYVDPALADDQESAKSHIKTILSKAVEDAPRAHAAVYPTIHFDSVSGAALCISQTIVFSRYEDAVSFEFSKNDIFKSGETEDDERAYEVDGLDLRIYGKTKASTDMRGFYRQEYLAGLFSSDFDAYSVLQFMPIYSSAEQDLSGLQSDAIALTCEGGELGEEAADKKETTSAKCMILRGKDVLGADKCPIVNVRMNP